jgi:hypothetical protein
VYLHHVFSIADFFKLGFETLGRMKDTLSQNSHDRFMNFIATTGVRTADSYNVYLRNGRRRRRRSCRAGSPVVLFLRALAQIVEPEIVERLDAVYERPVSRAGFNHHVVFGDFQISSDEGEAQFYRGFRVILIYGVSL